MKLETKRQISGWDVTKAKEAVIIHKQKAIFNGSKIARAEYKRVHADEINNRNAKLFESAKTETKASKKRQERKAQRAIKKFNKL